MAQSQKPWILRPSTRWTHFRAVPFSRLWILMTAVFLLFSVIGPTVDLIAGKGHLPYLIVVSTAVFSGLNAVLWILVLSRLSKIFLFALILVSFFNGPIETFMANWLINTFNLQPISADAGIVFASTLTLFAVIASYVFFVAYIRREGLESFRMKNELELAHGIQKTLVPPITLRSARFEVYGISCPSEKVGGDLVDALHLPNGDVIAYLADIAGHGLQAGILMGMLKTAVRTALLDAGERAPSQTLPVLLDRLNTVLPDVKEQHMYATFTGFRLGQDGTIFYALAANPPIVHWHAGAQTSSQTGDAQFPLGLIPVTSFDGYPLHSAPGDLLVVATDGILEVANKAGIEFGAEQLMKIIAAGATDPLPQLAQKVLDAARAYGKQFDDQTILLVRCL